jgi:CBS-domain-containing membrane protein
MKIKQIKDIVTRMFATFIATALGVVGSGALVGVDVPKAALMAGVGACAVVLERLSRSYLDDGVLSSDEINAAFGNDVVDKAIADAVAPDDHRS